MMAATAERAARDQTTSEGQERQRRHLDVNNNFGHGLRELQSFPSLWAPTDALFLRWTAGGSRSPQPRATGK